jgi:DNA processing protein
VVSEYFPGTRPDRVNFPQRNRIISGLSEGVVVVEAGQKSGALITANQAINQGREVFAVPGPPSSKVSIGANELIKKGAKLLTSVEDIFTELPRLKGNVASKQFLKLPDMTEMEIKIINLFENDPQQVDNISRMTNLPVSELMQFLLALEMKGVIRELSGKRFVLVDTY